MPKKSEKREILSLMDQLMWYKLIQRTLISCKNDKADYDEAVDLYVYVMAAYESFRYSVPFIHGVIPKQQKFLHEVVPNLDDERFKVLFRMSRETFGKLLRMIENDKCFKSHGKGRKQLPVYIQLQITLYRLGCSTSVSRIAFLFGVGDGGTVLNFCRRVFSAILKFKKRFIYWPNIEERHFIEKQTYHEMPHCIGYVDGTELKLSEAPQDDPDAYLSRKQIHAVKMQVVCDYKLRIRNLIVGYPGSVHDARMYNECELNLKPENFFDGEQYLLGDSAYKLTRTVITPFRVNNAGNEDALCRKNFNKRLSRFRVRVENTIGGLKERFESLKELRIALKNDKCSKFLCKWVLVCGVLYNFILQENNPNDFIQFEEILQYEDLNYGDTNLHTDAETTGETKRTNLMNFLFS